MRTDQVSQPRRNPDPLWNDQDLYPNADDYDNPSDDYDERRDRIDYRWLKCQNFSKFLNF